MKKINIRAAMSYAALATILSLGSAHAATITFGNSSTTVYTGSTTESGFAYSVASGSLFMDDVGNPGDDMEGNELGGGGVLDIRTAGAQLPFTFSQLDYHPLTNSLGPDGDQTLTVIGLLNGSVVATDMFTAPNSFFKVWTTEGASNLAGKNIDDLQIVLNAGDPPTGHEFYQGVDNIVLGDANPVTGSPVPEPSTLALLGTGILGVAGAARRKLTHA